MEEGLPAMKWADVIDDDDGRARAIERMGEKKGGEGVKRGEKVVKRGG